MNTLKNLKPWHIGRQQYRLNVKPYNMYNMVYPLVDKPYQFDAVLEDALVNFNKIAMEQTYCFYQPKMLYTKVGTFTIREKYKYKSIKDRIMSKFKFLKNFKFDWRLFRNYNFISNSEARMNIIRDKIPLKTEERFLAYMDSMFEELKSFETYNQKYVLIPLDYVKIPMMKGKYTQFLYKDRNTSNAALLLCYLKLYPDKFIESMKSSKVNLIFYTKQGIFRMSTLDVEETVIVGYAEGFKIEEREKGKLYGECQNPLVSDIFNTLYSEAYTVKEDKLIDATLVALRKLRGEGFLAEDMLEDDERNYDDNMQDLHGLDRNEDLGIKEKKSLRDEDLANAIGDAIKDDEVDQAETEQILRIISPSFNTKKDKVVVGKTEDGQLDNIRVREVKTTKQEAQNIQDKVASKMVTKLTDEKSTDEEVELAESIGRSIVGSKVNAEDIVNHVKRMKDIRLAKTKVYNAKEKKYLQKIKESETVEDELESVEGLKLDETSYNEVEALDDIGTNSFMNFNKTYENKVRNKDIKSVANHFSKVNEFPMYSQGIKEEDASNKFNARTLVRMPFKDPEGKQHNISLHLPKIVNGNKMLINGTWVELQSQRIVKPIVKFGDSVMMSFNYNKAFMELSGKYITRYESLFGRWYAKLEKEDLTSKVKYTKFGRIEEKIDIQKTIEFDRISKIITKIYKDDKNFIYFDSNDMKAEFGDTYDSKDALFIGKLDGEPIILQKALDTIKSPKEDIIATSIVGEFIRNFLDYIKEEQLDILNGINKDSTVAYSIMKIMSRKIPTILILCYTNGLDEVLERTGVDHEIIFDKKPRIDVLHEDLIEFKDCWVKYSTNNIEHMTLLSGLNGFDLSPYKFADFCDPQKGITAELIASIGNGNLPLYVTSFEMLFVDPINIDVLKHYNLPTTFIDVLLYANMLLATDIKQRDSDMRLYRIRSEEIIPAVMYKVLADAYADYHIAKKRGSTVARFEVPKDAVMKAIFEQANVQTYSVVNPMVSADSQTKVTTKGLSGLNLDRGYTLKKRIIDPSSAGTRAMPSVYSGGIGIVQRTPIDPNIISPRGYLVAPESDEDVEKLSAKQMLSPTELMTPGTTNKDDAQRVYMNMQQKGHMQGILHPSINNVSNGYDEMIGHAAPEFCHYMEKDGVVTDVNEDFVFVKYNDGTDDAFRLTNTERHSAKAKYIANDMTLMKNIKKGVKLKAQDPIAYNSFMFKEFDGKPICCTGAHMNVVFMAMPEDYEDATVLSESATEKLASYVSKSKTIVLDKGTIVKKAETNLRGEVAANDILFSYVMTSGDEALNELLGNNADAIDKSLLKEKKAGVSGTIQEINVYYACDKSTMSKSLRKFVDTIEEIYKARGEAKLVELNMDNFKKQLLNREPTKTEDGVKVANRKINRDDVVIEYIIRSYSKVSHSDKVTYFNALKGETSKILPDDLMPVGIETGVRAEACMSPTSIIKRKVSSVIEDGALERLIYETLEECKKDLGIK